MVDLDVLSYGLGRGESGESRTSLLEED